jgi:hypothetical protein
MSAAFEELGVPVRSVNWVRVHTGLSPDGQDRVWATMGQQADGFFVLDIDPATGDCKQISSMNEKSNYPTATFLSRSGVLYIGRHTPGIFTHTMMSVPSTLRKPFSRVA